MTKHKIISYSQSQRDDLANSTIEEHITETSNDAEATTTIQDLRRHGHIITAWLQRDDHVRSDRLS